MFSIKKLGIISILMMPVALMSCSKDEPDISDSNPTEDVEPGTTPEPEISERTVTINPDGSNSLNLPFRRISDTEFMIDYLTYKIVKGHLEVVSADKIEIEHSLNGNVEIFASIILDNSTYKVRSINQDAFYDCSGLTSVTIPNSVTTIGNGAFNDCSGLTSVTIPNSVTTIGSSAFYGCSRLTSVTIPNSVTTIGSSAFYGCSGLTSVTIPNSVTTIRDYAFYGCSGLTSVTIGNSVTEIGDNAFSDCLNLIDVAFNAENCTYCGSSYNYHMAFPSNIETLAIGENVKTIPNDAFYGCTGLTSVIIPNSVTKIGRSAFCDCWRLTSVSIGNSVTEIGNYAFFRCTDLKTIVSKNPEPPEVGDLSIGRYYITDILVYIPEGTLESYYYKWGDFFEYYQFIEGIPEGM